MRWIRNFLKRVIARYTPTPVPDVGTSSNDIFEKYRAKRIMKERRRREMLVARSEAKRNSG